MPHSLHYRACAVSSHTATAFCVQPLRFRRLHARLAAYRRFPNTSPRLTANTTHRLNARLLRVLWTLSPALFPRRGRAERHGPALTKPRRGASTTISPRWCCLSFVQTASLALDNAGGMTTATSMGVRHAAMRQHVPSTRAMSSHAHFHLLPPLNGSSTGINRC